MLNQLSMNLRASEKKTYYDALTPEYFWKRHGFWYMFLGILKSS